MLALYSCRNKKARPPRESHERRRSTKRKDGGVISEQMWRSFDRNGCFRSLRWVQVAEKNSSAAHGWGGEVNRGGFRLITMKVNGLLAMMMMLDS
jgi:hypothetical protein